MNEGMFKDTMVHMKWPEIKSYADKNAIVLLPLGVIEEHGPHLCLSTDIYTAHLQCMFVKQKLEEQGRLAVIAPPFYWGVCQSTGSFIGSFRIRKETAEALLYDILASMAGFGFKNIFGINAHGDIDHSIAILQAFDEVQGSLGVNTRYAFDDWRLQPFGLTGSEPYLCVVKPQQISISTAPVPDVHGGDIETATMNRFYPHLTDTEKAKQLLPVALDEGKS